MLSDEQYSYFIYHLGEELNLCPFLGNFGGSEIFLEISLKLRGLKFVSQKMWGLKFNSQKNVGFEISIQNVGSEIFVRKFVGS